MKGDPRTVCSPVNLLAKTEDIIVKKKNISTFTLQGPDKKHCQLTVALQLIRNRPIHLFLKLRLPETSTLKKNVCDLASILQSIVHHSKMSFTTSPDYHCWWGLNLNPTCRNQGSMLFPPTPFLRPLLICHKQTKTVFLMTYAQCCKVRWKI